MGHDAPFVVVHVAGIAGDTFHVLDDPVESYLEPGSEGRAWTLSDMSLTGRREGSRVSPVSLSALFAEKDREPASEGLVLLAEFGDLAAEGVVAFVAGGLRHALG